MKLYVVSAHVDSETKLIPSGKFDMAFGPATYSLVMKSVGVDNYHLVEVSKALYDEAVQELAREKAEVATNTSASST